LENTYLVNGLLENGQLENRQLENEKYSTWLSPKEAFIIWLGSKIFFVNVNNFKLELQGN